MVLPPAAGAALGYLAVLVPALRRWLAGDDLLDLRTRRRAEAAFLEEEVFRTRDRTGILLFVSLFEHRVVVLGDSGINARVAPGEWDEVVRLAVEGIRRGRPGEGLAAAIAACGRLLARPGLERLPDDTDELPDELRRRDS
jgi:putative membrane protein